MTGGLSCWFFDGSTGNGKLMVEFAWPGCSLARLDYGKTHPLNWTAATAMRHRTIPPSTSNHLAAIGAIHEERMMNTAILLAALSCNSLPPDAQAYCAARQHGAVSYCYAIHDADTRTACIAEVGRNLAACNAIGDAVKRQECRNRAGS